MVDTVTITREPDPLAEDAVSLDRGRVDPRSPAEQGRRRFTIAVLVGTAIVVPPLLWLLWDLWSGSVSPLRGVPYDNFYDLQARAIFHGHLYLPNGKMGIEAFVHDGRDYTYFGLFPSIIRMPFLLVTSSLDGKMTAPSILLAWLLTALFSSLMLWRVRILMRGDAVVGRSEATAFGALMATIMGGSVIIFLAATPFVYNEDFAWSVPLTVGSLFALLGVLERPTRGGVIASGVLILCANLDRAPTGYACTITAILVAGWFALGRGRDTNRRWAWPVLAAGIVPFLVSCLVTYAKFGLPVGLPMAEQMWATVNAHRRYFLAANGGKAFSFAFLPSTLWAYLQPFGIRVSGLFPFVTPPGAPAAWLGGVVLDQTYPTASFTATTPLLFLLGCWGTITTFRPRALGQLRLVRFALLGAAAGSGGVLLWGYISERYIADLMPFFIIASGVGLVDVWRRLTARSRKTRGRALGLVVVVAAYCIAANVAIAAFPVAQWTTTQDVRYVTAQRTLSVESLAGSVHVGSTLPYWAPAGQLFATDTCSGLYMSTGNSMVDVPGQQLEHYTWMPVEQSPSFTHVIGFTFNQPVNSLTEPVPLMTYGPSTLVLERDGPGYARIDIVDSGTSIPWPLATGWRFPVTPNLLHEQLQITVTTDPNLKSIVAIWYEGEIMINHYLAGDGPAVVKTTPASSGTGSGLPVVTVAELPRPPGSNMALCRSLLHNR